MLEPGGIKAQRCYESEAGESVDAKVDAMLMPSLDLLFTKNGLG
jgi:hypothetical protein